MKMTSQQSSVAAGLSQKVVALKAIIFNDKDIGKFVSHFFAKFFSLCARGELSQDKPVILYAVYNLYLNSDFFFI